MKNLLEKIRSFFAPLGKKFKRKPKDVSSANEPATTPLVLRTPKADRFTIISWVVTILVVAALLGSTIFYKSSLPINFTPATIPTGPANGSGAGTPQVGVPVIG